MRAHDYTTLFKLEHMLKDLRLCLEEARAAGVSTEMIEATESILAEAERARPRRAGLRGAARGGRGARGRAAGASALAVRAAGGPGRSGRRRASGGRSTRSRVANSTASDDARAARRRPRTVSRPATSDPPIPISIVCPSVIGSLPGSARRASAPTTQAAERDHDHVDDEAHAAARRDRSAARVLLALRQAPVAADVAVLAADDHVHGVLVARRCGSCAPSPRPRARGRPGRARAWSRRRTRTRSCRGGRSRSPPARRGSGGRTRSPAGSRSRSCRTRSRPAPAGSCESRSPRRCASMLATA